MKFIKLSLLKIY